MKIRKLIGIAKSKIQRFARLKRILKRAMGNHGVGIEEKLPIISANCHAKIPDNVAVTKTEHVLPVFLCRCTETEIEPPFRRITKFLT